MDSHDDTASKVSLTSDDVAQVVKNSAGSTAKVLGYSVQRFSKETVGFLGSHYRMIVTYETEDGTEERRSYFVKCLPCNPAQLAVCFENGNFRKETTFYRELMPQFLESVNDSSWCARCFLVKEDALVFEDLSARNFSIFGKVLDVDRARSALSSLARLHAASLLTRRRLGDDRFLRGLYPEVFRENVFRGTGLVEVWLRTGTDLARALAKRLGLSEARVPEFLGRVVEIAAAPSPKWNVVCHGDPWINNLLFDEARPAARCVLVDYQQARYASPVFDVSQLLYLTTRRELRERSERDLLAHYHRELCEVSRRNDGEIELPEFREILLEYEEMRVVGIAAAVLYFPLVLIDGKLAAEMIDDFEKLVFKDRVDIVLSMMQKDKLYEDRINEVIREMVERAETLL